MSVKLEVRPSAIAGQWYPAESVELRQMVTRLIDAAEVALPTDEEVVGLIAPHAGYLYSGPVAAYAYRTIRGQSFERVVMLGPLHRPIMIGHLAPAMVSGEDAYETPLGIVPVDQDFRQALAAHAPLGPIRADVEHSLEIQLPFLQATIGQFSFVPLLLAEPLEDANSLARTRALGKAIAATVTKLGGSTLLVASSDLSHLPDYQMVRRQDERLARLVTDYDLDGLAQALATGQVYACGGAAVVATMVAAQALGATRALPLRYATSGDITGDKRPGTYTVGYLAAAMTWPKAV